MKTYDSERKELFDWMTQVMNEYFEEGRKDLKEGNLQRDSEANRKFLEAHMEYNRKLIDLKKKYGIK